MFHAASYNFLTFSWCAGASNELYAHPRNCRKYYKCQNNEPSLQSCPADLIFDTNLKICNWPTASECVEVGIIRRINYNHAYVLLRA